MTTRRQSARVLDTSVNPGTTRVLVPRSTVPRLATAHCFCKPRRAQSPFARNLTVAEISLWHSAPLLRRVVTAPPPTLPARQRHMDTPPPSRLQHAARAHHFAIHQLHQRLPVAWRRDRIAARGETSTRGTPGRSVNVTPAATRRTCECRRCEWKRAVALSVVSLSLSPCMPSKRERERERR